MDLRYYVPAEVAGKQYPPGKTRKDLDQIRQDDKALTELYQRVMQAIAASGADDANRVEREEYAAYRVRAVQRLIQLTRALAPGASPTPPDGEAPTQQPTQPGTPGPSAAGPATTRPAEASAPQAQPSPDSGEAAPQIGPALPTPPPGGRR
jgi:hypothetical protein